MIVNRLKALGLLGLFFAATACNTIESVHYNATVKLETESMIDRHIVYSGVRYNKSRNHPYGCLSTIAMLAYSTGEFILDFVADTIILPVTIPWALYDTYRINTEARCYCFKDSVQGPQPHPYTQACWPISREYDRCYAVMPQYVPENWDP